MLVAIKMHSHIFHQWVSTKHEPNVLATLLFTFAISAGGPADILREWPWLDS